MKVSDAITALQKIQEQFGDIAITGGLMSEDQPLEQIRVTDDRGVEVWPEMQSHAARPPKIDGVFFQ